MANKLTREQQIAILQNRLNHSREQKQGGNKSSWSDEEKKIRTEFVLDLICKQGMSKSRAVRELMDIFGMVYSGAYRWVHDSLEELVSTYDDDIDMLRAKQLERLQSILETSINGNDKKAALSALDQMAKINGLYTENKNLNVDTNISFDFQ